jgi:TolB-like protein
MEEWLMHSLSARVPVAPSTPRGNPVHQLERVTVERETARSKARFANFEVDLRSRELRKHGVRMRLAEKPFQILELLLANAGAVVTRKALREKLWPDTHVGYEHSLNTAVNTLREMLGDTAQNPRYIETIPRLGYRFVCAIAESAAPPVVKKLAVLPFENLSSSQEQEHFADGLTEEIISRLGQLDTRRLGVIARTTCIQYKRTQKSILEIAAELGVNTILEGSVRRSGDTLRITAQLIDAADQTHLWSATFDRELGNALVIQSDVARDINAAVARELLSEKAAPPVDAPPDRRETLRVATAGA